MVLSMETSVRILCVTALALSWLLFLSRPVELDREYAIWRVI